MKILRVYFIILVFPFISIAQNLDSLRNVLKTTENDSLRYHLLIQLSDLSQGVLKDKYCLELKYYCEYKLKVLTESNPLYIIYKKGYIDVLRKISKSYLDNGDVTKATELLKQSLQAAEKIKYKIGIGRALNDLGAIDYNQGNNIESEGYFMRSSKIFKEIENNEGLAESHYNLGQLYFVKGELKTALEYFESSLSLYKSISDKKGMAYCLNNIGMVYDNKGEIKECLKYYSKSLKFLEELNDKQGIAYILINIGLINLDQNDISKAKECFLKSLKNYEELKDKQGQAYALMVIGNSYKKEGNLMEALKTYENSLRLYEETGDMQGVTYSLNNLGLIYFDSKDFSRAKHYFLKQNALLDKLDDITMLIQNQINLGQIFFEEKDYKRALVYGNNSLKLSKQVGYPEKISFASYFLFGVNKKLGHYSAALENYELFIKMRDSVNNLQTQRATIKQQSEYEYQKKKEIDDKVHELSIKQQNEMAAAEKHKQNIIIAAVSVVLLLVAVFSIFLYNRFKVTQKQKVIIELKEQETQNANLLITQQKQEVEQQKHVIEEKHKEITDSINYAERIQRSFLATNEHLNANLPDYFVLFKPKDVVSGDFYWSATLNNGNFILATADSTGHGVPGAIMSLLNITSLEKAIETVTNPEDILNLTRKTIIERLKKDGSTEGGKDGMDCSLISFNKDKTKLQIAAANNPVWIVRKNEVIDIKPDKMPVGKHDRDQEPFTLHEIDLQKGDVIYTLTDGFPDQFGGEKGKKFMSKKLKELLTANSHLSMTEQEHLFDTTFRDWVGDLEQIDDVTLIGVRV